MTDIAHEQQPRPLTNKEHSDLFHAVSVLWERVHGSPIGCFCGSEEELIATYNDLRAKAAQLDDQERE
ncbi:hypothetical protein [Actinomycetospora flava]|uniref:Uncharacterized protein n=1 Tax=Actinomycetospora flava TaxID=3129232 RepID=A0ABU8MG81_9PSEU